MAVMGAAAAEGAADEQAYSLGPRGDCGRVAARVAERVRGEGNRLRDQSAVAVTGALGLHARSAFQDSAGADGGEV